MKMMNRNFVDLIQNSLEPMTPVSTELKPEAELPGLIKAVLFDIYGTLLISGTGDIGPASEEPTKLNPDELFEDTACRFLPGGDVEALGDSLKTEIEKYHAILRQEGTDYPEVEIRDIWKGALSRLKSQKKLEYNYSEVSVEKLALKYELMVNPVWPMPGFPEIIEGIRNAGYRVGIVSNAQFYTPLILEAVTGRTLVEIGFETDLCVWSYELLRAKPSPDMFMKPLRRLSEDGIHPCEVLYVGNDMLNDVQTASAAGCRTALFAGDQRSLRLRKGDTRVTAEPDMIVTQLTQLDILIPGGISHGN
jgi:putative hydrolase of the HAD superfamily